jgi:hypothetical protein
LWAPLSDERADPFPNLWNLGTWIANGEFISFLSHDDFISSNYCDEMINLFKSNDVCFSAAPLPASVNSLGEINTARSLEYKEQNKREKLIKSFELGLCPESAYAAMIQDVFNNINHEEFWNQHKQYDVWIHNLIND